MVTPTTVSTHPPAQPLDPRFWLEDVYRSDQRLPDQRERRRIVAHSPGEVIWLDADVVWVVCRGVVQVSMLHPNGDEVLLGLIAPAMPFGAPFTSLTSYAAKALTPVELLSFSLSEIEQSPNLTQALFRQLGRRLRQTEAFLAISSHRPVEERLRHLLLLLKLEVGEPHPQGAKLTVKLTHQQLANTIGTSRVTITRLLGKFKAEQLVQQDRERYFLISDKLQPSMP
jgi:CRP-like cAMP-binding protein